MAKGKKTGGRSKGQPNKVTVEKQTFASEVIREKVKDGASPLEIMLDNMRFAYSEAGKLIEKMMEAGGQASPSELKDIVRMRGLAQSFAADAAPYVHPKLATTTLQGDKDNPLQVVNRMFDFLNGSGRDLAGGSEEEASADSGAPRMAS